MIGDMKIDNRSIKERQDECDRLLREKLSAENYHILKTTTGTDLLKFALLPALMGREVWDVFWAVFKDSVEIQAERMLKQKETPQEQRGVFG